MPVLKKFFESYRKFLVRYDFSILSDKISNEKYPKEQKK